MIVSRLGPWRLWVFNAFFVCFVHIIRADSVVTAWGRDDYGQTNVPPDITNAVAISSGAFHQLALLPDGTVRAWGADYVGQSDVPAGLGKVMAVAAGGAHSLALLTNGTVRAWGYNAYDQASVPPGLSNVVAIAGGWQHSLALKRDGTVVAWGNPSGGGPGSVVPAGLVNVTAIAASYHQNLALRSDGTVVAWGGDPGLTNVPAGLSNVVAVAAAYDANLALKSDGTLTAWGYGTTTTNLPANLNDVVAIAGGYYNFIALKSDGGVVVWGDNASEQTNVPSNLTSIAAIATGNGDCATLAVTDPPQFFQQPQGVSTLAETPVLFAAGASGAAPLTYQWKFNGTNLDDATGAFLLLTNVQPAQAGSYSVVASNVAGATESQPAQLTVIPFLASVTPANQLLYIGDTLSVVYQGPSPNHFQWRFLGAPLADETNGTLVLNNLVTNHPGAFSVTVSNNYGSSTLNAAVATVTNRMPFFTTQPAGTVVSPWGTVTFQASAEGSKPITYQWQFNGADIPGATNGTLTITNLLMSQAGNYSVRVGNSLGSVVSSNALLAILNVVTWGATNGSLGVVPPDLTNAIAICAGYHSVALKSNGRVVAWGDNYYGQTNVPANLSNVVAIAAAYQHTVALRSNGTVVAWGTGGTNVPAGLSNVIAIAAGDYHGLALKTNGTVVAWGDSGISSSITNVPANATNVVAITAGGSFSAALKADGTVVAWGSSPPSTNGMTNVVAIAANEFPLVALKADGSIVAAGVAKPPASLTNVVAVAAGRYHALALKSNGTVVNWTPGTPITPDGLTNVTSIASGQSHCLAIIGSGPQPASFAFANLNRISNKFSLTLPAQFGHLYWLEYKNSLDVQNWQALPLNLSTGTMVNLADPQATNASRLYRAWQW